MKRIITTSYLLLISIRLTTQLISTLMLILTIWTLSYSSFAETTSNFTVDKIEVKGDITLEWLKETKSSFSFFRIRAGLSEDKSIKINKVLKNIQHQYVEHYLSCVTSWDDDKGMIAFEELRASLKLVSSNLLSFSVNLSYFCKGMARPNTYSDNYLYDLNTQKKLKLNDLFHIHKPGANTNLSELEDSFYQELDTQNILSAHKIREFVFINKNWDLKKPVDDESCDYTNLDVWHSNEFMYSVDGIWLTPSFYVVDRLTCSYPFLIRFEQLARFKKNTFPYRFEQ